MKNYVKYVKINVYTQRVYIRFLTKEVLMNQVLETEKKARQKRKEEFLKRNSNVKTVITVLKNNGITVEEDFWEKCAESLKQAQKKARALSPKDVERVIEIANYWKGALLNDEEYVKLVSGIVCRLYQVQCVCITNNPECPKLYVGRFAKVNDSELAVPITKRFIRVKFNLGQKVIIDTF